jgi:hypothetical protein
MITETAAARLPSIRRKKSGDGMLTPIQVLEFRNPWNGNRVEQLLPGRDQVAPEWWGYQKHPELFMPVNRGDTATVARHRRVLEGARRRIERKMGTTRATTSSRQKRFRLPERRRERFRLP